jgi:TolB-like protein
VQFLFDNQKLDTDRRELHCGKTQVAVEPQVFDLLIYLVENRDRVVSKDDLIASVWRGRIVSDSTLASRINAARRAVGDSGEQQRLIRTVARRGVRFIGSVSARSNADKGSQPEPMLVEPASSSTVSPQRSERPAIAVLPFTNASGEVQQEYFSDGISEDIITALSRLRWFLVIARNSSFTYKGRSVPMKQIGEELGIRYLLDGSVRKSGECVRITAQLNDVTTGKQLWAERYDRRLADLFAVQDEITNAIVAAIEPQVYAAETSMPSASRPRASTPGASSCAALSHYWLVTRDDNLRGCQLLEQAIAAALPVAERAAQAAVSADNEDPWAPLALATINLHLGRFDDSLAEFEMALRLNPNFSLAQG